MKNITTFFIALYVRATYCRRAIARINKLKLGDIVYYQGARWTASQGLADPYWDIVRFEGLTFGKEPKDS
jgi:hypothetical protein